MSEEFEIVSVNVSEAKGTVKHPVERIEIDGLGVVHDAHAGPWHRQVTLLSREQIQAFSERTGRPVGDGEFAENLTTRGIDLGRVAPLDRLCIGDVELEVTQIGKECHGDSCAIFRDVGQCIMPKEGIFCRAVTGGTIRPGDRGRHEARPLLFCMITLSDRASAGEYPDRSGPAIREMIEAFAEEKRWRVEVETRLIPDDADALRREVRAACDRGAAAIVTTGSTGVGPRDIAPETVQDLCDKTLPGIMEHIRVKFGATKPNALLSRGVAGLIGTTQVYTLPGSVRAVREYMGEILKTLEHLVLMVHGVDAH